MRDNKKIYRVALGEETLQVDEEGLRELVASGKVGPDTLVACEETGWRFVPYRELGQIEKGEGWRLKNYTVWVGDKEYQLTGAELLEWIKKYQVGPLTRVKPEDGEPTVLSKTEIWRVAGGEAKEIISPRGSGSTRASGSWVAAGVIYFILAAWWFLVAGSQVLLGPILCGLWNFFVSVAYVIIGIGLVKGLGWGRSWGIWSAVLSLIGVVLLACLTYSGGLAVSGPETATAATLVLVVASVVPAALYIAVIALLTRP